MPAASGSWSLRRKTGASRIHERERPQVTVDIPNREAYGLVVLHSNALHAIPSPSYKPRAPLCIDCGQRGARRPILRQTSGTCLPIQSGKRGGSYGFRGWYTICAAHSTEKWNGVVIAQVPGARSGHHRACRRLCSRSTRGGIFHDGDTLTADDVVFSFDFYMGKESGVSRGAFLRSLIDWLSAGSRSKWSLGRSPRGLAELVAKTRWLSTCASSPMSIPMVFQRFSSHANYFTLECRTGHSSFD